VSAKCTSHSVLWGLRGRTEALRPLTSSFAVKPRLTIRDIAREAGVSTATVSRVMNSPESVAPDTRCAVQTVIDRHGYLSHGIAMSLASSRSMSIGLVIPTIINSIYASSTQAIQGIAQAAGYTVLLGVSEFSPELEEKIIRQLLERRVDGLILTGGERKRAIYDMIEANGVPYVVTWKLLPGNAGLPSVSFDNHRGGLVAMEHLIALGHRKIGLICGRSALNDRARERRRAYEESIISCGLEVEARLIHEADFELDSGRDAMRELLGLPERPTAVFCANDVQAIGALHECEEHGLRVPADISLVGFDDLPIAKYVRPQLTTIRVPAQRMGELAATRIIEALRTGGPAASAELPIELVVRDSTAAVSTRNPRGRLIRMVQSP
jgi:LacI family transcriptional regulator